jgi:hypothetical protein
VPLRSSIKRTVMEARHILEILNPRTIPAYSFRTIGL